MASSSYTNLGVDIRAMILCILLLLPILLAVAAYVFLDGITWKEFLVQLGVQVLIAATSMGIVYFSNTTDVEVWNGRVTSKDSEEVSCSHSYPCNCRQECSGEKNDNCSQVCDICYAHAYDVDWNVATSNGEVLTIARIDSQGVEEPPRWTAVKLGEPTAVEHRYTSYIKGAPDTLFRHQGLKEKYATSIPEYPGDVYDYYRLDRVIDAGVGIPDHAAWSNAITEANADLGAPRQVNIIVVFTTQPRDWFYALEEAWIGGKKNDVVLVIGVNKDFTPSWVEVMAWTIDPIFKIKLRDDLIDEGQLTPKKVTDALLRNIMSYHRRKPMKDFEYLKASIVPSTLQWILSLMVGVLSALGLAWFFHVKDIFGEGRYGAFQRRRNIRERSGRRFDWAFFKQKLPWR